MKQRSPLLWLALAVVVVGLGFVAWSIAFRDQNPDQELVLSELAEIAPDESRSLVSPPAPDAEDDFPAIIDSAVRDPETHSIPAGLTFEIIETIPHDTNAFTQGLELADDRLFESTGLVGASSIREVDPQTGEVLRIVSVDEVFAEGLTVIDDSAIQLTWKDEVAYRYDLETFTRTDTYAYEGEGWGLCDDGTQLVMSNGTPTLQFRDRDDFRVLSTVEVLFNNSPVDELNELECVNGRVWANIWRSSLIIEIEPTTGQVVSVLNARSLTPPSVEGSTSSVLNGIAYDPADDTYLLTGKNWPTMYRVRIETAAG